MKNHSLCIAEHDPEFGSSTVSVAIVADADVESWAWRHLAPHAKTFLEELTWKLDNGIMHFTYEDMHLTVQPATVAIQPDGKKAFESKLHTYVMDNHVGMRAVSARVKAQRDELEGPVTYVVDGEDIVVTFGTPAQVRRQKPLKNHTHEQCFQRGLSLMAQRKSELTAHLATLTEWLAKADKLLEKKDAH